MEAESLLEISLPDLKSRMRVHKDKLIFFDDDLRVNAYIRFNRKPDRGSMISTQNEIRSNYFRAESFP